MPNRNLAQRLGRWSAQHRRIAIFGWLAVVVASVFIGAAMGTQHLADEDLGNGESRQADQSLAAAGFSDRATEQVLVQGRGGRAHGPRSGASVPAIADVIARAARAFGRSPTSSRRWTARNAGQISRDRRSALVVFDIRGDSDTAKERVGPILDAVAQARARAPAAADRGVR